MPESTSLPYIYTNIAYSSVSFSLPFLKVSVSRRIKDEASDSPSLTNRRLILLQPNSQRRYPSPDVVVLVRLHREASNRRVECSLRSRPRKRRRRDGEVRGECRAAESPCFCWIAESISSRIRIRSERSSSYSL